MSPLAEVLHAYGHWITGSDKMRSSTTARLESLGISLQYDHAPELVKSAELLVYSSAVKENNPERIYARENGIREIRRAEILGELMRAHYTICICGTHGKTTTTSLVGTILDESGFNPTVLVGGTLKSKESNAVIGKGIYMVAEADEFDRSFLAMYPSMAIITNIEADHLDCYGNVENVKDAFVKFTDRVPFYGAVIVCKDDPGIKDILPRITRSVITYSINENADYIAQDVVFANGKPTFKVLHEGKPLGTVSLNIPGIHNVSNSLAAIAVAIELGIPFQSIVRSLGQFQGVERRFEIIGKKKGVTIIDDYAHHPGEIRATLMAARKSLFKRTVAVFQPHLYTRTRDFMDGFAESLMNADIVLVTDIYKAREEPIPGVTSDRIIEKMKQHGHPDARYIQNKDDLPKVIKELVADGDVVVVMGAGDIWRTARLCLEELGNE